MLETQVANDKKRDREREKTQPKGERSAGLKPRTISSPQPPPKKLIIIKIVFDLPSKRTWHGKGQQHDTH
jgi:hypothetical protein